MTPDSRNRRAAANACPEPEILGLYIERRLPPDAAESVAAHLTDCDDCFFVFCGAAEEDQDAEDRTPGGPTSRLDLRRYLLFGGLAAAALLTLTVFVSGRNRASDAQLLAAVARFESQLQGNRLIDPRLSIETRYRPRVVRDRSATAAGALSSAGVPRAAGTQELERLARRARNDDLGRTLLGGMYLAVGDAARAIDVLAPLSDTTDPLALNHLAAAYLVRRAEGDSQRAYELLERAVTLLPRRPEIWFNLGLAAEAEGHDQRAREAWKQVVTLESNGGWRQEARLHLERLQNR